MANLPPRAISPSGRPMAAWALRHLLRQIRSCLFASGRSYATAVVPAPQTILRESGHPSGKI